MIFFGLASCKTPPPPKPQQPLKKPKPPQNAKAKTFLWGKVFTEGKELALSKGLGEVRGYRRFKNTLFLWNSQEAFWLNLKREKIQKSLSFSHGISHGSNSKRGTALGLLGQKAKIIAPGGQKPLPFRAVYIAFHPEGDFLAYSQGKKTVAIYSLSSKKEVERLSAGFSVKGLVFSPRGKWLAILEEGRFTLWNAESWAKKTLVTKKLFAFGPKDSEMALYNQGQLERWDIYSEEILKSISTPSLLNLAYSPEGSLLGGLSANGKITLWNSANLEVVCTIQSGIPLKGFFFSPVGYSLYGLGKSGKILKWTLVRGNFSTTYLRYFKQREAKFQYQMGEEAFQNHKLQKALEHWKQALHFDPNYQEAKIRLGESQKGAFEKLYRASRDKIDNYLQKELISKALEEYDLLLRFDTLHYRPLEEILEEVGLLRKALAEYEMGEKLYRAKKAVQAYPHYRLALQYDPSLDLARKREQALWQSYYVSLPKEKKTTFLAVRKKKLPSVRKAKSSILAKLSKKKTLSTPVKKPSAKKPPVKKPPAKKPPTAEELFEKAASYRAQAKIADALAIYQKLVDLPAFARPASLAMAEIFYNQKKYVRAAAHFQKALALSPLKKADLFKLAKCYLKGNEKEKEKALSIYQKMPEKNKALALKILLLAKELGDLQSAYQAVSSLIQSEPTALKWREERYQLAKKLGQTSVLKKSMLFALLEDLKHLAREKTGYLMDLGKVYEGEDKMNLAKNAYLKGFQRSGPHRKKSFAKRLEHLGYLYSRGMWMSAEKYYTREGLVKWGKEWVTPLKKKLLQKITTLDSPPRRPDRAKTAKALANKRIIPGMNRRELVRVMGFWQNATVVVRQDESYEILYFTRKNRYVYLRGDLVVWVE